MARQNNTENEQLQTSSGLRSSEVTHISEEAEAGYASYVRIDEGRNKLSLLVKGVHCAACIQKIESRLYREDGILNARLNFSTGRLNIEWDGGSSLADDYVRMIEGLGYKVYPFQEDLIGSENQKEERFLLLCLGVAGFAMGNIMLLSVGVWTSSLETMGMNTRELMHWISALIALPTVMFSGRPFFISAFTALRNGHTNMDVPISLALILASAMSVHEILTQGEHVYFDSAVMLTFFLLIGRYLDFKARRKARGAALDLMQTLTGFALVATGDERERVAIRDLKEDMQVIVAIGDKIPVDGLIIEGVTSIDTSLVTGETLPRAAETGDDVYAGTINLDQPILIKVTKAAEDSLFADIIRLMEKAEQGQADYVRIADRAAKLYTPVVHLLALLAFALWWVVIGVSWQEALLVSVTVLIITCPCALGLAVPVVQVLATGRLMLSGVMVKSGDALERLAKIQHIVLDKTGTLTLGKPVLEGAYDDAALKIAASLAQYSRHPLSLALSAGYEGDLLKLNGVKEHAGLGLECEYNGGVIKLGNAKWLGVKPQNTDQDTIEIWFKLGEHSPTPFKFSDQLRSDTPEVIEHFKAEGFSPVMLSGDRKPIVQRISAQCGIKEYLSEQKPADKYEYVELLKQGGHSVMMVGDGLNDAPVLSAASISMAPGSAIDVAQNAADIVFMGDKLEPIWESYKVAKKSQSLVKQNFALAILYNMVAVPLAFMGLVTPMVAALAMSGSSLLVILNSFRLKGKI